MLHCGLHGKYRICRRWSSMVQIQNSNILTLDPLIWRIHHMIHKILGWAYLQLTMSTLLMDMATYFGFTANRPTPSSDFG